MNERFENYNKNPYEGNGWSKYQLLVLQQLDDHNKVLENLNKELVDLKQNLAVSELERKMWREQITHSIEDLVKKHQFIMYDEKGLSSRLSKVEREMDIEEQTKTRLKATWALYGAVVLFIFNLGAKLFDAIWKHL